MYNVFTDNMEPKKNIMLVDDDPLITKIYEKKLKAEGYGVVIESNGESAIITAEKKNPDLILLDIMMPKMSGIETLKILKEKVSTKNIPVIVLTNLGSNAEEMETAKILGAVNYLVKSETSLKKLIEEVKKIIS